MERRQLVTKEVEKLKGEEQQVFQARR